MSLVLILVAMLVAGLALGGLKEFKARVGALLIGLGVTGLIVMAAWSWWLLPTVDHQVAQWQQQLTPHVSVPSLIDLAKKVGKS